VESIWREIINQGLEEGDFQIPHPDLTTKALLGVLNWTITWYREDGALTPDQISDYFTDLFYQGLLVE
jgi:hypothetical protein